MRNPYEGKEKDIMKHLADAWCLMIELEQTHPMHKAEFCNGIHECQRVVMSRVLQRDYPDEFLTYKEGD